MGMVEGILGALEAVEATGLGQDGVSQPFAIVGEEIGGNKGGGEEGGHRGRGYGRAWPELRSRIAMAVASSAIW